MSDDDVKGKELRMAIVEGRIEDAMALIRDPATNINWANEIGKSCLHVACEFGRDDVIRALLSRPNINRNRRNDYGQTSLPTASYHGKTTAISLLHAESLVDVNLDDLNHSTGLWVAGYRGKKDVAEIILASGRNINTTAISIWDGKNTSAAQEARKGGFNDTADLIDSFEKNPEKIRDELRIKLNWEGEISQSFISLWVLEISNRVGYREVAWNPTFLVLLFISKRIRFP